jgi:membrane-bound lytic murein transglycosylase D
VLVPIAVANIIRNELALVEPSSRYRPRIITVEPNDTLSEISFLTGLSVEKIKKFNSLRSNRLRIGQRLLIPMPRIAPPIDPTILSKRLIATEHVVAANDTLWGIAAYYKTTIDNLIKENNIPPGSVLKIGQKLILPSRLPNGEDSNYHTVEQGESLWTIATKLGTTVKDLTNLNRLHDESILKIGQVIRVQ